ncbi:MAG: hypothetical protein V1797_06990, partial [Pseudomonadota bacterium]
GRLFGKRVRKNKISQITGKPKIAIGIRYKFEFIKIIVIIGNKGYKPTPNPTDDIEITKNDSSHEFSQMTDYNPCGENRRTYQAT